MKIMRTNIIINIIELSIMRVLYRQYSEYFAYIWAFNFDPSLIPGSEIFAGEGIGYLLQYSWASFVAQLVKVGICLQCGKPRFDHWVGKIPLEKGKATHSSILAWRIPWTVYSMRSQKVWKWKSFSHVWLFVTPWTIQSMEFSRPVY